MALRPESSPAAPADKRALAQQDVFMREVDDALREDQLKTALERYGKPVGAAVLALLLGLGGYLWWTEHQQSQAGKASENYMLALDDVEAGRLTTGYGKLEPIVKDGPAGAQTAARLMQAGITAQQGNKAQAAKLFAAVAADGNAPKPYRDIATIREIALNFDTLAPETVIARLKPLATPGNPWFGSAGELVAAAYLKQGRRDLAGALFGQIARDITVPDTLRSRTRQMAGLLGVDAVDNVDKALEDSPVAAGNNVPQPPQPPPQQQQQQQQQQQAQPQQPQPAAPQPQ